MGKYHQDLIRPVGKLLQVHLLVAVQQLSDIMADDAHHEGDEDNGQNYPQTDI